MLSQTRAVALLALGLVLTDSGAVSAAAGGVQVRDNLYDADSVGAGDAWVVGAFGTIFHSSDAGASWQAQSSGTTEQLFSVAFADPRHGWAVGRNGTLLHTDDGGGTWTKQTGGVDRHLFDVAARSPRLAVAVGDWGAILRTEDGGQTWEDRSFPRDVILNAQSWADDDHGWIVGEAGVVLMTTDGGKTWTEQPSGIDKTLFGVHFRNLDQGWAVGLDGLILQTVDGGQTWQVQHGVAELTSFDEYSFAETLGNPALFDIEMAGNIGWVVGDLGALFVSTDGGQTWSRKDAASTTQLQWIRAASLSPDRRGIYVGAKGLIGRIVQDDVVPPETGHHAP